MTSRPNARTRRAAILTFAAVGLMALAGCDPRTLFYFLQPFEPTVPAPGPSLNGKRVVILTHAVASAQGDAQAIDRQFNREVVSILRKSVKKIDVVDPDKVWTWVEGHPNWTNPADAAQAFEADMVIFLEVENFQVESASSPGLLEGTARVHIQAVELKHPKNSRGWTMKDKPKEEETVYDDYRDTTFPVRGPIPVDSGVGRSAFQNKFLHVVATEITWHFVDHSPEDDIQDVKFNNK